MTGDPSPERNATTSRALRGVALFRDKGVEFQRMMGGSPDENPIWIIPSGSVDDVEYVVDLVVEECDCMDYRARGMHCKHLHAATIAEAKLRTNGEVRLSE